MSTPYNLIAGQSLERLSALSDGLFAIAMTLLVLGLRVPASGAIHTEHDLWRALVALSPSLITYFMSFLTLGIFWVGQQTQLSRFARSNRDLTWIQIGFLLLLKDDTTVEMRRAIEGRIIIAQALYALGALLCVINTYWSIAVIVLVQLNYVIAPRVRPLYRL